MNLAQRVSWLNQVWNCRIVRVPASRSITLIGIMSNYDIHFVFSEVFLFCSRLESRKKKRNSGVFCSRAASNTSKRCHWKYNTGQVCSTNLLLPFCSLYYLEKVLLSAPFGPPIICLVNWSSWPLFTTRNWVHRDV